MRARLFGWSSFTANAVVQASGTAASRVSGFARDMALAYVLGAGAASEIFVVAFRFPNLFRRLFAEGAFHAAFLPLFAALRASGRARARVFAGQLLSLLCLLLAVLCAGAVLGMDWFIYLLAQGFADDPAKLDLAVRYSRIGFPYLFFMGVAGLFAAVLNTEGRFAASAFAPVILNVVLLAALGAHSWLGGFALDWLLWGVLAAGALQAGVLVWMARRAGWGLPFARVRKSARLRQFFTLFLPGLFAAGIAQINLVVGTTIASAQSGAVAWLYYADRLYQLPLGVIGVGLGAVLLPRLARELAAHKERAARKSQAQAVRVALYFTLPAALGLYALADPMMQVLFERGAFSSADSLASAAALRGLVLGLPAFVLIKLMQPVFFARRDTKSPMWDGAAGVAVNIALALFFFAALGHVAIALASSAAGWVTFVLMARRLVRLGLWDWKLAHHHARFGGALAAGLAMLGFFLWLYANVLALPSPLVWQLAWLGGAVGGGMMAFFVFSLALGGRPDTNA